MKYEILASLLELAAGPFFRLHQHMVYRTLGLYAESTLLADLIGAAARVLPLLALVVPLPAPLVLATLAVLAWAALVALVEIMVALCASRRA